MIRAAVAWIRGLSAADRALALFCCAVVGAFVVVCLSGVHQASLGISTLQDDGRTSEDVIAGDPRYIRSDDYLRSSPLILGQEIAESADFTTPLGTDPTITSQSVDSGLAEHLIFWDRTLIQASPLRPAATFAAYWWLMIALSLVSLPLLLRVWRFPLAANALTAAAVVVNPAMFWWSFSPAPPLALSCVAALAIAAVWRVRGRWLWPCTAAAAVVGGVAVARLPFAYFPWSLPIAASVIIPTVMLGLSRPDRRRATLITGVAVLGVGAVLALALLRENREAWLALAQTVYPGSRREGGALQNIGVVFGAPFLGILQSDPNLVATNQSEISTAWTISAVAALALLAAGRRDPRRDDRALVFSLATITAVGFSWVLFTWPSVATNLPLLNLVPAFRMMAMLGIPSALLLGAALSRRWQSPLGSRGEEAGRIAASIAVALVLLMAGTYLAQTVVPGLGIHSIVSATAFTALSLALLTARRGWLRYAGVSLAILGMFGVVYRVNPIMQGLGDLREGATAAVIRATDAELAADGRPSWAGDGLWVNAMLVANGVPTVSADQWTGPSELWRTLDPELRYRQNWNRGASMIMFSWQSGSTDPIISNDGQDVIVVQISPCSPLLADLGIGAIVSRQALNDPCLQAAREVSIGGDPHFVYRLR